MPLITALPANAPHSYVKYECSAPSQSAIGQDGRTIDELVKRFLADVREQVTLQQSLVDCQETGYSHVPFKRAGTMLVRFRAATPLRPRVIASDSEDE